MTTVLVQTDLSNIISDEELQAQDLVKQNEIDQAIAIYERLKPESVRILRIIGALYAHKKGDYHSAIDYFERALKIHDEENEETCEIFTNMGFTYQNRGEFDLALIYHSQALNLRKSLQNDNPILIAGNLFGLANAHWALENLSDALNYAQEALVLNESVTSGNDANIASNLAILANIYHRSGDDIRALEFAKRALTIFEHCETTNGLGLTSILNNIGTIQISAGLFSEALLTFVRALHICNEYLPEDHPRRIAVNDNVQRIADMYREDIMYSFSQFWTFLLKLLLV